MYSREDINVGKLLKRQGLGPMGRAQPAVPLRLPKAIRSKVQAKDGWPKRARVSCNSVYIDNTAIMIHSKVCPVFRKEMRESLLYTIYCTVTLICK